MKRLVCMAGAFLMLMTTACGKNTTKENDKTEATSELKTEAVTDAETESEEETTEIVTDAETESEEETTEIVTEEETESGNQSELDFTSVESKIPEELIDMVKAQISAEDIAYLYGDIDADKEAELLLSYIDYSTGSCRISEIENNELKEIYSIRLGIYVDKTSLDIIDDGKMHYILNLFDSFGTNTISYIFEDNEDGFKEVLNLYSNVFPGEGGGLIVQSTGYTGCLDTTNGNMLGRTWTYSYIEYDEESDTYKEYVASEIDENKILGYEGATEILNSIKNTYADKSVKYTYYIRNNGLMHIQCEYQNDTLIMYEYYTLCYKDGKILDCSGMQQGFMQPKFTSLDEI